MKKTVLLVGGTGNLGGMIGRALLAKPDVELRLLVREGSRAKVADLESRGAKVVIGDIGPGGEAALEAAVAGAFSVVSALQGGPDVLVEGQMRLFQAAKKAGVRRFIPSDYSYDYFEQAEGKNVNSDVRRAFARTAAAAKGDSPIELVHVLCGCFLDKGVLFGFLGAFDMPGRKLRIWGDGTAKMDFTTYADTAAFVAEAAVDPERLPERFNIAGETLDAEGLARAVSAGTGRTFTVEKLGTLAELDAEIARRRAAEPGNYYAWLPLMYWTAMLGGKVALGPLANGRYPSIRPTTVTEYVAREKL
jgi:nucleoside-diphosphate-sugar epimerase